jgi:hypothetical protein
MLTPSHDPGFASSILVMAIVITPSALLTLEVCPNVSVRGEEMAIFGGNENADVETAILSVVGLVGGLDGITVGDGVGLDGTTVGDGVGLDGTTTGIRNSSLTTLVALNPDFDPVTATLKRAPASASDTT